MKRPTKRELQAFGWRIFGFAIAAAVLTAVILILGLSGGDKPPPSPHPKGNDALKMSKRHRGGDALQSPSQGGQQPAPAPAGDGPNKGDREDAPAQGKPESPASDPPPSRPEPPPVVSEPPPTDPPGLLTPTLETICSVADRLAHLC